MISRPSHGKGTEDLTRTSIKDRASLDRIRWELCCACIYISVRVECLMESQLTIDIRMMKPEDGVKGSNSDRRHVSRGKVCVYVVVQGLEVSNSRHLSAG
jgi:hypothetical protein